mgnify:CR=1 FL=1
MASQPFNTTAHCRGDRRLQNRRVYAFPLRPRHPLETLCTTLALTDFSQNTIEQVVARVHTLARAHHSNSFAMGTLQATLPTPEETQFRQALECTICTSADHSALDCPSRPHCPIWHSETHTVEQCEYNMLNQTATTTVHQIEPRPNPVQPPPSTKEAPRPWDENRPHYHTANTPDTTCCNRENQYRIEVQNHPNQSHHTNGHCHCHQDHHHCCRDYGHEAPRNYRGF